MARKKKQTMSTMTIGPTIDELELDHNEARELWILLLVRGIATLAFGFVAVIWPDITLLSLAYLFSVFVMIIGVLDIINGIRMVNSRSLWFLKVFLGVSEIAVGLYLLRGGIVVTTLLFLQALGLILILQSFVDAIVWLRRTAHHGVKALSLFNALVGFVVGAFLLRSPVTSGLTFVWLIGFYGLLVGAITIAAGFSIRPEKT